MHRLTRVLAVLLVVPQVAASCAGESDRVVASRAAPIVPLDTAMVVLRTATDSFPLRVEVAETSDQTRIGLMERESLPEEEGMIFLFDEQRDATASFYMFRTLIPLDIAYLDEVGRIVAIRQMEPCASPYVRACEGKYPPGVAYQAALEVNRGYFAARGIGVGDQVRLLRPGKPWP